MLVMLSLLTAGSIACNEQGLLSVTELNLIKMNKEQMLKRFAMNIVNQLFDLADVPVEKRQAINDKADEGVLRLLQQTPCYVQLTPLLHHYDNWCKETKRNGGVLVGSSIRELIEYLEAKTKGEIKKALIAS